MIFFKVSFVKLGDFCIFRHELHQLGPIESPDEETAHYHVAGVRGEIFWRQFCQSAATVSFLTKAETFFTTFGNFLRLTNNFSCHSDSAWRGKITCRNGCGNCRDESGADCKDVDRSFGFRRLFLSSNPFDLSFHQSSKSQRPLIKHLKRSPES
jgi:hypothetical protein